MTTCDLARALIWRDTARDLRDLALLALALWLLAGRPPLRREAMQAPAHKTAAHDGGGESSGDPRQRQEYWQQAGSGAVAR